MFGFRGLVSVCRSVWSSCGGLWWIMIGLVYLLILIFEVKFVSGWRGLEWRGFVFKLVL